VRDWSDKVELVREAERMGIDKVWSAEAWGQDAVAPLGYLAAITERVKLGSHIMQVSARVPSMTAMTAMTLAALSNDRFILATKPCVRTVEARGERVNFVLMPFPTPSRYGMLNMTYTGGAAAANERIVKEYAETAERLRQEAAESGLPAVLLTHVTVEGTEVGPHRLSPRDDIVMPRSLFPSFELSVVGHIHKAEKLSGAHFYYVGVLDRMDMGELYYEPRVLLADITPKGKVDVKSLPLDPTPFAEFAVETEEDLQRERGFMAEPERTLVKLHIRAPYGTYTAPLINTAKELFPRLYGDVQHEWTGAPAVTPSVEGLNVNDPQTTIRRYIEDQVPDEKEREQLLELVDELSGTLGATPS